MNSTAIRIGDERKVQRLHKYVLNAVAFGVLVSMSMAASAPTRSDHPSTPQTSAPKMAKVSTKHGGPLAVGTASWYGEYFDGKQTASGEPYDMYELTAAHRTLPMGSWVKVTNLKNHLWVLVRINDRGPVPEDRIIDLSYSAARMLHMSASGLAHVRLDLVKEPPPETSEIAMLDTNR
jgi:rare lipoprotein A